MSLGRISWGKAKRDPGDAQRLAEHQARVAASANAIIANPDGTATYKGWTVTPDPYSGVYQAQKPGTLDVITATSLPALRVQVDAAEASGANPNAPVAVYQGWSIVRAGGAGTSFNPFSLSASSGPLYVATQAGRRWPAQKPKTLQEVYAIIDRIVNGENRPQDAVIEDYQGWSIRQVETDGRFYAKNPSTSQQIGGMPSLAAVRARIDQYMQPMQPAVQGGMIPYYGPQQPAPYGYPYASQQPVQRDMWGNPVQNSYVPQTSADPSQPVPMPGTQAQLPYQPAQANQISYYQPVQGPQVRPMPSQGAEDYGYAEASDDDATYTGTNGFDGLGRLTINPYRRLPWWQTVPVEVSPIERGRASVERYNGWGMFRVLGLNGVTWSAQKSDGSRSVDGFATKDALKAAIDRQNLADAGVSPAPQSDQRYKGWLLGYFPGYSAEKTATLRAAGEYVQPAGWHAQRGDYFLQGPYPTVEAVKAAIDQSPDRWEGGVVMPNNKYEPNPTPSPAPSPSPSPIPTPTPGPSLPAAPTVGGNAVRYGDWLIRAGDPSSPGYYNQQPFFASNGQLMAIGQTFPDIVAKIDRANKDKPSQLDGLGAITAQEAMGGLLALGAVAGVIMVAHQLSRRRK
jgi:hypothetical protein